jgi:hypothetical protein
VYFAAKSKSRLPSGTCATAVSHVEPGPARQAGPTCRKSLWTQAWKTLPYPPHEVAFRGNPDRPGGVGLQEPVPDVRPVLRPHDHSTAADGRGDRPTRQSVLPTAFVGADPAASLSRSRPAIRPASNPAADPAACRSVLATAGRTGDTAAGRTVHPTAGRSMAVCHAAGRISRMECAGSAYNACRCVACPVDPAADLHWLRQHDYSARQLRARRRSGRRHQSLHAAQREFPNARQFHAGCSSVRDGATRLACRADHCGQRLDDSHDSGR